MDNTRKKLTNSKLKENRKFSSVNRAVLIAEHKKRMEKELKKIEKPEKMACIFVNPDKERKPLYNACSVFLKTQKLELDSDLLYACKLIFRLSDKREKGTSNPRTEIRNELFEKPVNLVSLAFRLRNEYPELRAIPEMSEYAIYDRRQELIEKRDNSPLNTWDFYNKQIVNLEKLAKKSEKRAWKALLEIDKKIFEPSGFYEKSFYTIIEEITDELSDNLDIKHLQRAKQVILLPEKYISSSIARTVGVNRKQIINEIDELGEIENTLANIRIPSKTKYSESFSEFNTYYQKLKEINNRVKEIKENINKFGEYVETCGLGSLLDSYSEKDIVSILTGNEDEINEVAKRIAAKNRYDYSLRLRDKESLEPEDISNFLRLTDTTLIRKQLRTEMRSGKVDIASCLGVVNGRKGNKNNHCHTTVARHKIEMTVKSEEWSKNVLVNIKNGDDEGVILYDIIKSKQLKQEANMSAIMKGYEMYGKETGKLPLFLTYTLPPEWHSAPKSLNHRKNNKWNYLLNNCREARKAISKDFSRFRANISKKRDLRGSFGLRVNEFHQDGCPHLHTVLWVNPQYREKNGDAKSTVEYIEHVMKNIMCEGRDGRGYDIQIIDETQEGGASPTSYVMKYVRKSLSALSSENMAEDCEFTKYRAMLSATGARAFSFIGSRGIRGLWDRIYNSNPAEFQDLGEDWQAIAHHVHEAKRLWNETKDMDNEEDGEEISGSKLASRKHGMQALMLLGAFPDCQNRYKITGKYSETLNKYGETSKKQTGYVLRDEHGQDFLLNIKKYDTEINTTIPDDKMDTTGIRKQKQRKQVIETLRPVFGHITKKDIGTIGEIFNGDILGLSYFCNTDTLDYIKENKEKDNQNNILVSLILTDSRKEPAALFMNDNIENIYTEMTPEQKGLQALEALRTYYQPLRA
ncbi:replication endonuclease [Gluconobacter cerinus]|uniref:replication endonuclease n=1 Tax=Gluconobacter cerinus TaxID=38307 RepID=UPI001B8AD232|nr:replication endonuclease [Gluconobacter cerinus]MBS1035554.1 replication endonuclease [Gluconobacter cerinus]